MTEKQKQFADNIAECVKKIAPEFGIKVVSPIVAQAILESGWGTSNKAKYNNFFGLKYREGRVDCNSGYFKDGSSEQLADGTYIPITTDWYSFKNMEDGVRGYFQFINIDRYKNLKGVTDPFEYIQLIREDGYATSLQYVESLTNVIKNNNLTKYDQKEEKPMAKQFKVHLDAGHYGKYNQSPANKKYYESEMAWKLVNYLADELKAKGITVTKSRSDINKDLSLNARGKGAKGCDLFLSIHSNAVGSYVKDSVDYPVVYRRVDRPQTDEFGLKLAKLIQEVMGTKQNGRTATRASSNDKDGNGKLDDEYYGVLNGAEEGGVDFAYIVEHSFHTCTASTNWLLNENNIKTLAKKEAELICSYFNINVEDSTKKEETKTETAKPTTTTTKYYRVRKSWNDAKSQIGAYTSLENAKKVCKSGYKIYDWNGKQVYPEVKKETVVNTYLPGTYKVTTSDGLNIRKGPSTSNAKVGAVACGKEFVVNEIKNTHWGKLTNGKGWISIHKNYCKKISNVTTIKKTNEEIAREVIQGKWGNGSDRKNKLTKAGYNYSEVQKIVNKLLS